MICLSIDRPPAQPVLSLAFFHLVFLYRFLDGLHSTLRHWSLEHAINIIMNRTVQLEASLTRHTLSAATRLTSRNRLRLCQGHSFPCLWNALYDFFPATKPSLLTKWQCILHLTFLVLRPSWLDRQDALVFHEFPFNETSPSYEISFTPFISWF